jgi:hypothetical protein
VIWAIGCRAVAIFGYAAVMATATVITALAGIGAFLAAVAIGVVMVLGGRSQDNRAPDRIRRYLAERRRDGRGL